MAEHRLKNNSLTRVEFADHLVARDKWKTDPVFEVRRGMALNQCNIGSADAGEPGVNPMPTLSVSAPWTFRVIHGPHLEWAHFGSHHR
jgi:hypothetical protein